MGFPATIVVITVVLVEIQGMNFYPGRQVQNYSSYSSAQPEKQHYAESILYLTPSQIKALREGEDQLYRAEVFHADSVTHHAPEYQQALEPQQIVYIPPHHDGNPHSQFVYPQPNTTPDIPQSPKDPFHIIPPPNFREPKTIEYNTFQTQKQKRILKPIPFIPDSDKQSQNNEPNETNQPKKKPTTPKPVQETDDDDQLTRQQLKEQWLDILKQNIAHFKVLEVLYKNQILSNNNNTNFHYLAQNDDKHNDKNHASEVFNLVRSNNQDQLNKQRSVLQSEAVANAPPLPYDDINIKQTPAPFVAHDAGQTPEWFSVPESFEDKSNEFPIEYFRTVSYPNVQMQTNEEDRPVPTQAEVQIPFAVTNNAYYGDRPFSPVRVVPVKNPAPNRDYRDNWPPYMREQRH